MEENTLQPCNTPSLCPWQQVRFYLFFNVFFNLFIAFPGCDESPLGFRNWHSAGVRFASQSLQGFAAPGGAEPVPIRIWGSPAWSAVKTSLACGVAGGRC